MKKPIVKADELDAQYQSIFGDVSSIIDEARQTAARSVNAVMTAAYWMIGQHIVEFEQGGKERAEYGTALVERLAVDLTERFGRGFSVRTVWQMKAFYLAWSIPQTVSAESESSENLQTASVESSLTSIASRFPLPWSAYVRLLSVKNINARDGAETRWRDDVIISSSITMNWIPSRAKKRGHGDRWEKRTQNRFWMRSKDKGA